MIGLFVSQVMLFAAAALLGFAAGWRLYSALAGQRRKEAAREIEAIRAALSEAQVRRARAA